MHRKRMITCIHHFALRMNDVDLMMLSWRGKRRMVRHRPLAVYVCLQSKSRICAEDPQ